MVLGTNKQRKGASWLLVIVSFFFNACPDYAGREGKVEMDRIFPSFFSKKEK